MKVSKLEGAQVEVDQSFTHTGFVYLECPAYHLTPAEARRVAAALVKEAEKAEKKGRRK